MELRVMAHRKITSASDHLHVKPRCLMTASFLLSDVHSVHAPLGDLRCSPGPAVCKVRRKIWMFTPTVLKLFPLCLNICILEIIGEAWWRLWSIVGVNLIWQSKHLLSYGWIPYPFVEKIRFFKIQPSPPLPAPLLQTYRTLSFRASFLLLTMLASNAHCPAWKCLPFYSAGDYEACTTCQALF